MTYKVFDIAGTLCAVFLMESDARKFVGANEFENFSIVPEGNLWLEWIKFI